MGRIAILNRFEYEYEYRPPRRTEYEYEKKYEQSIGPKCSAIGQYESIGRLDQARRGRMTGPYQEPRNSLRIAPVSRTLKARTESH